MATIVSREKPYRKPNEVLAKFAEDTLEEMGVSFSLQRISPYTLENGAKEGTGKGLKSLETSHNGTEGQWSLLIRFNDYLRFVDMGVGRSRPIESVERGRKARHTQRYVPAWDPEAGETHRPHLMMEARHLEARLQNYFENYYGKTIAFTALTIFNEENPKIEFKF